jgi:hypothetical protein
MYRRRGRKCMAELRRSLDEVVRWQGLYTDRDMLAAFYLLITLATSSSGMLRLLINTMVL